MVSLLPMSWNGVNSGRVQEPAAADAVEGQEVAELSRCRSPSRPCRRWCRKTRSPRSTLPKTPPGPEAGAGGDLRHQAGLVAEFGIRRSGDDFHALDGAGRKLRGEDLALLIADGLSVDHEADLRVIAQRVEESVRVGGHAARAVSDRLAQAASGVERGQSCRSGFGRYPRGRKDYVSSMPRRPPPPFTGLASGHHQGRLDLHRQGAPDGDSCENRSKPAAVISR